MLSGRKMSGGMVESPAEKNKPHSFHNAESLGLIKKERINSQEQIHYCSSMGMALELNNLKRVDMPLNKEAKPNQTKPKFFKLMA